MKHQYSNKELLVNKCSNFSELLQKFNEGVTKMETNEVQIERKNMINYTVMKNRLINMQVQYSEIESVKKLPKLYNKNINKVKYNKSNPIPITPHVPDSYSLNMKNKCKILVYKLKKMEEELSIKNRLNESIFDTKRLNSLFKDKPIDKKAEFKKTLALQSLNLVSLPSSVLKEQIDKPFYEKLDLIMAQTAERLKAPLKPRIRDKKGETCFIHSI